MVFDQLLNFPSESIVVNRSFASLSEKTEPIPLTHPSTPAELIRIVKTVADRRVLLASGPCKKSRGNFSRSPPFGAIGALEASTVRVDLKEQTAERYREYIRNA